MAGHVPISIGGIISERGQPPCTQPGAGRFRCSSMGSSSWVGNRTWAGRGLVSCCHDSGICNLFRLPGKQSGGNESVRGLRAVTVRDAVIQACPKGAFFMGLRTSSC